MNAISKKELGKELSAINKSIVHWETMIAWARKQLPDGVASMGSMLAGIGQAWGADDCPLCDLSLYRNYGCTRHCPLGQKYGSCNNYKSPNSWDDVSRASTWKEWIASANYLLGQLKNVKAAWLKKLDKKPAVKRYPLFIRQIINLGACSAATKWLKRRNFKTLQEAWGACKNGSWMMWLLSTHYHMTHKKPCKYECCWTRWSIMNEEVATANMIREYFPKAPNLPKKRRR